MATNPTPDPAMPAPQNPSVKPPDAEKPRSWKAPDSAKAKTANPEAASSAIPPDKQSLSTKDKKPEASRSSRTQPGPPARPVGSDDEFTSFIQMAGHLMRSAWAGYNRTKARRDILGSCLRGLAATTSGLGHWIRNRRTARKAARAASRSSASAPVQITANRPSTLAEKRLTELKLLHAIHEARATTDPLAAQQARDIGRILDAAADPSVMAALVLTQDHRSPEVLDAVRQRENPSRRPWPTLAPATAAMPLTPVPEPQPQPGPPSSSRDPAPSVAPDLETLRERLTLLHRNQTALTSAIPTMAASAAITGRVLGVIDNPGVMAAIHASGDHADPQVLAAVIAAEASRQSSVSPAQPVSPSQAVTSIPDPASGDLRQRLTELQRTQAEIAKAVPTMAEAAAATGRVLGAIDDPGVVAAIRASGDHTTPEVLAAVTAAEANRAPAGAPVLAAAPAAKPASRPGNGVKLRVTRPALGPSLGL